jgi:hypothetical protein
VGVRAVCDTGKIRASFEGIDDTREVSASLEGVAGRQEGTRWAEAPEAAPIMLMRSAANKRGKVKSFER